MAWTIMKSGIWNLCIMGLSIPFAVAAQTNAKVDAGHTVKGAYQKYVKDFPGIQVVRAKPRPGVVEKKEVVYTEIGDRKLYMDVFHPNDTTARPAMVLIHGGGWISGDKSLMTPLAEHMASNGYACFALEYRLSGEARYPASIIDVQNAIKYIRTNADKFHVDTTKVAILGCSSGGQMAALIGTTITGSRAGQEAGVQAIIDLDGILAFKHPESEEGNLAALWLGGTYEENPENWKQASALTHVDENTPPMLFVNSGRNRFHAGRDDMIEILKKNNTYYEVKEFPDSPHTFWLFEPYFTPTVQCITDFLNKIFLN